MKTKVIGKDEARIFLDGPEVCREYISSGKITFGSSTLLPGQNVSRGEILMYTPSDEKYFHLKEGDIIIIPEGVPHQITNIGSQIAIITWSCSPSPE